MLSYFIATRLRLVIRIFRSVKIIINCIGSNKVVMLFGISSNGSNNVFNLRQQR